MKRMFWPVCLNVQSWRRTGRNIPDNGVCYSMWQHFTRSLSWTDNEDFSLSALEPEERREMSAWKGRAWSRSHWHKLLPDETRLIDGLRYFELSVATVWIPGETL